MEAQLLWDRAFAEALVQASKSQPGALVVGIIGSGHLRSGHGVPYQLNALGVQQVRVWLPISARTPCAEIEAGLADAVFAVKGAQAGATPRLGVLLDDGDPIKNVPQSVRNEGHVVLAEERLGPAFRLIIRRRGDSDE